MRLETRGPDAFFADHPAYTCFLWQVVRQADVVIGLAHGSAWRAREQHQPPPAPPAPAAWAGYTGH